MRILTLVLGVNLLAGCDSSEYSVRPIQELRETTGQIVSEEALMSVGCQFSQNNETFSCKIEQEPFSDYKQFIAIIDFRRKLEARIEETETKSSSKSIHEVNNRLALILKSLKISNYLFEVELAGRNCLFFGFDEKSDGKSNDDFVSGSRRQSEDLYTKGIWNEMKKLYRDSYIRFEYNSKDKKIYLLAESLPEKSEMLVKVIQSSRDTIELSAKFLQRSKAQELLAEGGEAFSIRLQYLTILQSILAE